MLPPPCRPSCCPPASALPCVTSRLPGRKGHSSVYRPILSPSENPGSRFSQPHQSTGPPLNLLCQSTGPCEIPQVRSEDSQSYSPPSIPLHLVPDEPACHPALQNPAPAVSAPPGVQPVMDIAHWKFHMQSKQACLIISYTSERIKF